MLETSFRLDGTGGGVITLPVFPLGLESELEDPLPSLEELATASVPAEELGLADPLPSLEELATASVPAEELADPLPSLEDLYVA